MKSRPLYWITLLALVLTLLIPSPAFAAGDVPDCPVDECVSWPEAMVRMGVAAARNLGFGAIRILTSLIWLMDKVALYLFELIVNGGIWISVQDALLQALSSFMPGVLGDLIGGEDGLFYIALMIAGVGMTIPFFRTRMVDPAHAVIWAVILMVLFVSGSAGYDVIGALEGLRVEIMDRILAAGNDADLSTIVTGPFGGGDLTLNNDTLLHLPEGFAEEYFPPAQSTITLRSVFIEIPLGLDAIADFDLETDESLDARRDLAFIALSLAMLSLVGAYSALLFALIFAFLVTASLGLIIFLFASLPMGFFEFGRTVVAGILNKYIEIFILSIGASIFVSIVVLAIDMVTTSSADIKQILEGVALLLPVIGVEHMFLGWAFTAMMSSKDVFRNSMQASFAPRGGRPGFISQATQAGLRTAGMVAPFMIPGAGGVATSFVSNMMAGNMAAKQSVNAETAQTRGDVFREMQKPDYQGGMNV